MFLSPRLFLRKKSPFLLVIYIIPLYDFPRLCDACHESNTFFIFQAQTHNGSWARAFYYTACCAQYHIYPLLWLASTTPSFWLQFPNFRWHWIRFSTWTSLMSIPSLSLVLLIQSSLWFVSHFIVSRNGVMKFCIETHAHVDCHFCVLCFENPLENYVWKVLFSHFVLQFKPSFIYWILISSEVLIGNQYCSWKRIDEIFKPTL